MNNSEYMTTQDVKKLTGLNSAILFKLRKSGKLPCIKISNKTILYKKEDIDKILEQDITKTRKNIVYYSNEYHRRILQDFANKEGIIVDEYINDWSSIIELIIAKKIKILYIANTMELPIVDFNFFYNLCNITNTEVKNINNMINYSEINYIDKLKNLIRISLIEEDAKKELLNILARLEIKTKQNNSINYSVYVIIDNRNSNNEKDFYYYIGSTRRTLKVRLQDHKYGITHNEKMNFYENVRKFSKIENLSIYMLEEVGNDNKIRYERETYYIQQYREKYGRNKVYNESEGSRNYDNPEHRKKFTEAGIKVRKERVFKVKRMLSSNCMIFKYKEEVIIGKLKLREYIQKLYPDFTMKYDRFKIFCNTGRISQNLWNMYGQYLKDIFYLDKKSETWKSVLELHSVDVYNGKEGLTIEDRTHFLGQVNPITLEWQPSENKIRRNRKSNNP